MIAQAKARLSLAGLVCICIGFVILEGGIVTLYNIPFLCGKMLFHTDCTYNVRIHLIDRILE